MLWVWGNPEPARPGAHTIASFRGAPAAERARLPGVPNVVMAGKGLPDDAAEGIVFLSIHNDPAIVGWTAEWVARVGDLPLRAAAP